MRVIATLLCLGLSLAFLREITLLPDGRLHLRLLDVGQGDSLLLTTPSGGRILIDGGPNLSTLSQLGVHLPLLSRRIDLVILTHSDADHITALPEVLLRYNVRHLLLTGQTHNSGMFDAVLAAAASRGTNVLLPSPSTDLVFSDGVTMDIVWPNPKINTEKYTRNDASVVTRVLYKDHSILLTGDIEEKAEQAILAQGQNIQAETLKVAHHGSKTSSSTGFLLAVNPRVALISSGTDNRFGHPHTSVITRLNDMGITIKNTADEGGIELVLR